MPESAAPKPRDLGGAIAGWLRPNRKQLVWAVALCVVAAAIVIQVQSSAKDDQYAALRRDDLVQLLDGLTTETDQLTAEVAELERTRDALASGADAEAVAAQEAQKRADTLGILEPFTTYERIAALRAASSSSSSTNSARSKAW